MYNTIIIRNGEIAIKGENRTVFEKQLIVNIKNALYGLKGYKIYRANGRLYIDVAEEIFDIVVSKLKKVFGVVSFSPAIKFEKGYENFKRKALELYNYEVKNNNFDTFKLEIKRSDKNFNMKSPEMVRDIAGYIISHCDKLLKVDVLNPQLQISGELRDNANILYTNKIKGLGGLPVGINGKAMSLLSGGIDSPVATYLASKRGLSIEAIHFHSFPFTSEKSMQKVEDLAKIISRYIGQIKIYKVNLLPIQKEISENCPEELMTILSRRFMMRIAEKVAIKNGANSLITGESIGQVASQTMEGLTATNDSVKHIPVIRPLISFDKEEIIDIAKKIKTFETSIIPEEDCCTVFLPKKPSTKPKLEKIYKAEEKLNVEFLVDSAIENMQEIII